MLTKGETGETDNLSVLPQVAEAEGNVPPTIETCPAPLSSHMKVMFCGTSYLVMDQDDSVPD